MPHKPGAIPENKAPDPLCAPVAQDCRPIDGTTVELSRDRGSHPTATASDDLTLNSKKVAQNVYLRGSLSSGESGLHCTFTPVSSSLVFGPRGAADVRLEARLSFQ
jgi:hypothetical protein